MANTKTVMRYRCPVCRRPNTAVRNFEMVRHNDPQTGEPCHGVHPETFLTMLLRLNGLDVRPDSESRTMQRPRDAWDRKARRATAQA